MPCLPYTFTLLEASALLVTSGLLCPYIHTYMSTYWISTSLQDLSQHLRNSLTLWSRQAWKWTSLSLLVCNVWGKSNTDGKQQLYNFTRHREAHSPRSCYPRPYTLLGDQIIIRVSVWSSLEHLTTFFKCYPKSFMQSSFSACLLYDSVCVSLCLLL